MKSFKLAVVMDPIQHIHPEKDTSFAIMLAAQAQGCPIYYFEIKDLFLQGDTAYAHSKKLQVQDNATHWFNIEKEETLALDFFDVILMRKDPPVDEAYWHATQILDFAAKKKVCVLNKPQSLRDYNEKIAVHHFPHLAPPTIISAQMADIKQFIKEHKDVICKPLDGMGGKHIFKATAHDPNLSVILEMLTQHGQQHIVCQRFIPEVKAGDKRIILIDGKPIPYALARIPQEGEVRGNLASGGTGKGVELTKHDYKICEELSPFFQEKGLFLVGLDVIGNYVTEINITSPTCVREISKIYNIDIAGDINRRLSQLINT